MLGVKPSAGALRSRGLCAENSDANSEHPWNRYLLALHKEDKCCYKEALPQLAPQLVSVVWGC